MAGRKDQDDVEGHLYVGVITGAKGIKGEVRIKSFTTEPQDIAAYGPVRDAEGKRTFTIKVRGLHKGQVTARLAGIDDRSAAEALKGVKLYVARDALPEPEDDEFYHTDLMGLSVELEDGVSLGTVREVHEYGAGTSLEVSGGEKGTVLVPFTAEVCPVVDLVEGKVVVNPPPGLFEAPKKDGADDEEEDPEDAAR